MWRLGKTDAAGGDLDSARKRLTEALRALRAFEMKSEVLDCLEDYVTLLQLTGQAENAVRAYSAAASVREALGIPRSPQHEEEMQGRIKAACADLGAPAFQLAWATGRTSALDEVIDQSLSSTASD